MDDCFDRVLLEYLRERRLVAQIDPVKFNRAAAKVADALQYADLAVGEVVHNGQRVPCTLQRHACMRANIAQATGY